ncbi:hypothetical protein LO763_20005 [Glycomyces sp. A-F 0318]|uniref:hypothetical protein n=1 Tax=Glycomyces amatae TaxID=2881355 RepID=UPI001E2D36B1|nr:hypothetical protein [Glycomyces amatae]MCD0445898.1 hypothetical protein [Glycomyces amatae]
MGRLAFGMLARFAEMERTFNLERLRPRPRRRRPGRPRKMTDDQVRRAAALDAGHSLAEVAAGYGTALRKAGT